MSFESLDEFIVNLVDLAVILDFVGTGVYCLEDLGEVVVVVADFDVVLIVEVAVEVVLGVGDLPEEIGVFGAVHIVVVFEVHTFCLHISIYL